MAFPTTPTEGQLHSTGGVTYQYNSTVGAWQIQTYSTIESSILLSKLVTVDGDTSGLDSDLLDGNQGSYYTSYSEQQANDAAVAMSIALG